MEDHAHPYNLNSIQSLKIYLRYFKPSFAVLDVIHPPLNVTVLITEIVILFLGFVLILKCIQIYMLIYSLALMVLFNVLNN